MRVVVNHLSGAGNKAGVGHYTTQLLDGLATLAADVTVEAFPQGWIGRAHAAAGRVRHLLESGRPQRMNTTPSGRPSWRGRVLGTLRHWERSVLQRHFEKLGRSGRFDLYHEPNYIPLEGPLPTVASVHDLSVLLYPEWHPADRVAHYETAFRQGVARCDHILTGAEVARQEIIRILGVPPERVTVTPYGVRAGLGPLPPAIVASALHRLKLPPRYLLYLGTLEPRKNLLMLLRVYCSLPTTVRQRYPLLLVGGWGWNTAKLAEYLEREAQPCGVRRMGYIPDEDLPVLYNGARALLFPSFYEGFGLPPVEMLACGGAVLASTAGALVETVGGHAHLTDPHDIDGWHAALLRITQDDDWHQALRLGAVEAARPFTWERCAAATLAVYRQVCAPAARKTAA